MATRRCQLMDVIRRVFGRKPAVREMEGIGSQEGEAGRASQVLRQGNGTMSASKTCRAADTWQAECERAASNTAALLRIARRYAHNIAILEILRSAPRSPDEEQTLDTSPFMRCLRAARLHAAPYEKDLLQSVTSYFD